MAADQPTVLVVEDELAQREVLAYNLEADGFRVIRAENGEEGLLLVEEDMPDIIVLDWMMPNLSGIEVCRRLKTRSETRGIPIIMLSARSEEVDKVRGLETGADDYITKPFKLPVLLARLRAQLRTHEQSEDAIFTLGPYTFKPAQKMLVTEDDKKIRLTEKETNILKFLYRSSEGVVARDVLLHEVWGYNAGVTTHTLETHIYRLRQKIEPDPSNARLLVTEAGGYRLAS